MINWNNIELVKPLGNQHIRTFGKTYLGRMKNSGDLLVLKSVNPNNSRNLERLSAESTFGFSINGLPKIVGMDEEKGILALEYQPGIPLDTFWEKIPKKQRHPFILQFLQRLIPLMQELERHQIVHCDLKPSNLLISGEIDNFSVYLIDFGLALRKNALEERTTLFPLGFAAPELVLNRLHLADHRTDLYSLGIIIWRLFVGELPLTHKNPSIFTNLQITHPLPDHSQLPKDYHTILQKMARKPFFRTAPNRMSLSEVDQLLTESIENRYPSFQAALDDLQNCSGKRSFYQRISFR